MKIREIMHTQNFNEVAGNLYTDSITSKRQPKISTSPTTYMLVGDANNQE